MPEICVRYVQLTYNIDLQPNQATSIILAIYCMAGNFGGLLKICHLAEFTLAVEPGLAIIIFITKWLLKRAGILIGP